MTIHMGISKDGTIKISTTSERVRKDDLNKWLKRNRDAILLKLIGHPSESAPCSVGHICRIEKEENAYFAFIGKHRIGQLPEEVIAFAEQVDSSPEYLISIVGKVENNDVFIYVAE